MCAVLVSFAETKIVTKVSYKLYRIISYHELYKVISITDFFSLRCHWKLCPRAGSVFGRKL